MHTLTTLYFPGTDIFSTRQFPLFLFFQRLHLLKPVENADSQSPDAVSDIFIKSGLCQVHTPAPLGKDRTRFLRLLHDIESRRDDYAAQLSNLTLAALSAKKDGDEESEQAILRSLHGRPPADDSRTNKEDRLWQARLLLAIGEILDSEEEEVAHGLMEIEDNESDLFRAIRGDIPDDSEENPFAELQKLNTKLGTGHSGNIRKRFRAWQTILLAGASFTPDILLTVSREAADLLLEEYEQKTGLPSPLVATYDLPGFIGWNSEEALQTIQSFTKQHSGLLQEISNCQSKLATARPAIVDAGNCKELQQLCDQWNALIMQEYPEERHGRMTIHSYELAGVSGATILGFPEDSAPQSNAILMVAG